jgi:hypothetical protein
MFTIEKELKRILDLLVIVRIFTSRVGNRKAG